MMGLSAYGEPRFAEQVRRVVRTEEDQCRLNLDYFTHHSKGVEMTWYGGEPALGAIFSHKMVEEFGDPRVPAVRDPAEGQGPGGFRATGARGELFRAAEFCPEANGSDGGLPGRRRGAELRGQRHDLRAHELPGRVRTAGGARRRDVDWRGALCAASRAEATAVL